MAEASEMDLLIVGDSEDALKVQAKVDQLWALRDEMQSRVAHILKYHDSILLDDFVARFRKILSDMDLFVFEDEDLNGRIELVRCMSNSALKLCEMIRWQFA